MNTIEISQMSALPSRAANNAANIRSIKRKRTSSKFVTFFWCGLRRVRDYLSSKDIEPRTKLRQRRVHGLYRLRSTFVSDRLKPSQPAVRLCGLWRGIIPGRNHALFQNRSREIPQAQPSACTTHTTQPNPPPQDTPSPHPRSKCPRAATVFKVPSRPSRVHFNNPFNKYSPLSKLLLALGPSRRARAGARCLTMTVRAQSVHLFATKRGRAVKRAARWAVEGVTAMPVQVWRRTVSSSSHTRCLRREISARRSPLFWSWRDSSALSSCGVGKKGVARLECRTRMRVARCVAGWARQHGVATEQRSDGATGRGRGGVAA